MKSGDIVFFKKAKRDSRRSSPETTFEGYCFGVLLGHVPPFHKDPNQAHAMQLMGTAGFVSFDDIIEFLGEELGNEVLKRFEDKYHRHAALSAVQQAELPLSSPV